MNGITALTIFALGMRHGADPDHLAAIDNVTRNSLARRPGLSRLTGLFFAAGHSVMLLGLAVVFAMLSKPIVARFHWLENAGSWISIVILLSIAALNIEALLQKEIRPVSVKARLIPRMLREARTPLAALPIGFLFGLGFETSSQLAAYGLALSRGGGWLVGAQVGAAFCAGLVATDLLDGVLVHRVVTQQGSNSRGVARVWSWIVTIFAVAVAVYELAPYAGFVSNQETDLYFGMSLMAILIAASFMMRLARDGRSIQS